MRLIDADALRDEVLYDNTYDNDTVNYYLGRVDDAPTISAVPVVRCKECEDYDTSGCSKGFGWCENMDRGTHDEFYCANGKRLEVNKGCLK